MILSVRWEDEMKTDETTHAIISNLIVDALLTDGAHHKQWFLERIALELEVTEIDGLDYEPGIAP
jgi:hypothetical protein